MTKIEKTRKALNGTEVHDNGNDSFEYSILVSISEAIASDKEIIEYADSKNVDWEEVKNLADKANKKANRVLNTFDNMNDLNDFRSKNECGEYWYDDNNYYVYAY